MEYKGVLFQSGTASLQHKEQGIHYLPGIAASTAPHPVRKLSVTKQTKCAGYSLTLNHAPQGRFSWSGQTALNVSSPKRNSKPAINPWHFEQEPCTPTEVPTHKHQGKRWSSPACRIPGHVYKCIWSSIFSYIGTVAFHEGNSIQVFLGRSFICEYWSLYANLAN